MTEHIPLEQKPRDRFLEAAQKELAAFERRERRSPNRSTGRFAISDADIALLLKKLPLRADDAEDGTGL